MIVEEYKDYATYKQSKQIKQELKNINMKEYYIGIDPGKSGAIVIIDLVKNTIWKYAMPLISKELDCERINDILFNYKDKNCHVVIEKVHALFGSGASATFDFGYTCGALKALLIANGLPFTMVQPKEWQKEVWQGISELRKPGKEGKKGSIDTKGMALLAVKQLFPKEGLTGTERSKKAHDGIVDALLMAEYGRRKF